MAGRWRDPLRDLLRQRTRKLSRETVERQGDVSAQEVEELDRLSQLLRLRDSVLPYRRRLLLVAGLIALYGVLSLLLFVRVSSTEVAMDLKVGEVGLTLAERQKLTDVLVLDSITVAGLRELHLPRSRDRASEILGVAEAGMLAVRLSAASEEGQVGGSVTLAGLVLPAGSRCWLARTEADQFRLSLSTEDLVLRVDVHGTIKLEVQGRAPIELEFPRPRGINLVPAGREIDLSLALGGSRISGRVIASQLPVEDLSFVRVDEVRTTERTMIRLLSTIHSGMLYFESLGGREHPLRTGEMMRFTASTGWLRSLRLESDHLAFDFRGNVQGMSLGTGVSQRSLMPTLLDWLRARQSLALLWGAAIGVLCFLELFLYWWRSP